MASDDNVVSNRPRDNPTAIELLEYITQSEIHSMARLGRDCGKLELINMRLLV